MNFVESLEDKIDITVSTMRKSNLLPDFTSEKVLIHYNINENKTDGSLRVLTKYFLFSILTLWQLIRKKPDVVLYYESISAWPVYLYKRFFRRKVKVCIHYHEYMSLLEYDRPGMRLSKANHKLEHSYLYQRAKWISQTNEYRRDLFLKDYPGIAKNVCRILPNYPPKSWQRKRKEHNVDTVKCVYVGSLSLKDTYVLEFCQWINQQNGKVTFDIYSFNFHKDTLEAVEKLHSPYIHFYKDGVSYSDIPALLDKYDVGLLLYKARTMNFKWNETNKFYEYLVCGLDVWYPKEMTLLHEMDKSVFAPQILEMDITQGVFPAVELSPRQVDNSSYDRFCEKIYESFLTYIKN